MRTFQGQKRLRVYLKNLGMCAMCGRGLQLDSWEADHIIPWSRGGPTEVWNGQALCSSCHALKMTDHPFEIYLPGDIQLREWQKNFCEKFLRFSETQYLLPEGERRAFILNAFPASGKTFAQLACAKYLISTGLCNFFVVVVPTQKLRDDFVSSAEKFGIRLYGKTAMRPNFMVHQGVVLTYQQLSSEANVSAIRLWVSKHDTFISGDEIHHLSDNNSWGENFELAFGEARVRLLTTGTPFRSDNARIPWCKYHRVSEHLEELDLEGESSYSYGYSDALADGNVRECVFPTWRGRVNWRTTHPLTGETQEYDHAFEDNLKEFYPDLTDTQIEQLANQRNSSAVSAGTDYLRDQIISADKELQTIRETHPWAGGLIVCQIREHADQVARLVFELTGDRPIVVHGDVDGAKEQLRSFQNDTSSHRARWLITVQMVTEGVDIKHLRVLVYATSKTAPLFWTQVLGRILRYEPDAPTEQTAVFYQYADDRLVDYALRIQDAVETLRKVKEDTGGSEGGSDGGTGVKRETEVISAEGQSDTRIYGGEAFNEDEIKVVEDAAKRLGMQTTKLYAQLKAAGGVEFYERLYKAMSAQDQDETDEAKD